MTNVILTAARTYGPSLVRTAGRIGLAYANQAIANAFDNRVFEGPRLETLHIQSSRDGAPMARVYGRARIAGQVIWAARVNEIVAEEKRGGKGGGPRNRNYKYTISFAIGLCEGEILGIGQIWANGAPLQTKDLNTRLYTGTEVQNPDPLIAEIEGVDVPAFRGTAYMVFEDMPLDDFGARLPQLNFEIIRQPKRTDNKPRLEDLVTGVDLIPGSGEFAYGSTITEERLGPGTSRPINMNNLSGSADMDLALDQLQAQLPNCNSVTLVVSWFGDDLRAAHCKLRPGVENRDRLDSPENWRVGDETRASAYLISQLDGHPAYGGTPSDVSIIEAVQNLKARGFQVLLYPFVLMDVPPGNQLPNPYGGSAQPVFPWRGRITCDPAPGQAGTADKTAAATTQIGAFFGTCLPSNFAVSGNVVSYQGPAENSFRRMILHYAHLMQVAGGVDAFIIGSEMRGLTTVRGANNTYPSVTTLQTLAADVRSVLGAGTKLTYAADWSEYFGHHPVDGSSDVIFHLDPLWADANIDAVGIDAYFPLSDWRDGSAHVDAQNYASIYDTDYLAANMEGGEGYDWYYASSADRDTQARSPITDGAAGKPWVFRYKDVKSWWANVHYDRAGGTELSTPTVWQPESKPIWFTEVGCSAIDKGANQPNVFWDPKSSESYAPYYSSAIRDDLIQRRYIETFLSYWDEAAGNNPVSSVYAAPMVAMDFAHIWTWDARPFPDFPARDDIWVDGVNWRTGHWISGRTGLVSLADIISDICLSTGASAPDVSMIQGMVSGYVIDRPMSARAALTPLSIAYGFDLTERAGGLSFATRYTQASAVIDPQKLVLEKDRDLLIITRADIAAKLKDVRLSFIDQGRDYQAGLSSARDLLAETVNIFDVQAPLVLDPAQAKTIANALLERAINEIENVEFSVPPQNLNLEAGDLVQLGGQNGFWQIENLDGLGKRSARARKADISAPLLSSGGEPGIGNTPGWVSAPDGFVLDIAGFGEGREGPLVGVVVSPYVGTQITGPDGNEAAPTAPVAIGALLQDFAPGPVGRTDNGSSIDIYLPGASIASLDEDGLLAGGNLLAVETALGWEIFQCQNAELISENTYRISRFLRGLYGTDRVLGTAVPSGARIIYLAQGWQDLALNTALRGSDVQLTLTANGRAASQAIDFTYEAAHLRPLSPVHIKTKIIGSDLHISWTRRTRVGGDDWASLDVPLGETSENYEIEFAQGGTLLITKETNTPNLQIPINEIGSGSIDISITQISQTYGPGAVRQITIAI